jgi:hypothetical protein
MKLEISLVAFAATYGYALDARETSRNSAVMRHASGDKIIVARASHGHWIYFSVRDDSDNGTIIDFIQHRKPGATLGHVRRELAAWSGTLNVPTFDLPDLKPVSKDRAGVLRNWGRMSDAASPAYLEARGLSPALLASERFAGTLRLDARRNAVFPHRDDDGVCGYEIKNRDFTGFATGGVKALWLSNRMPDDSVLVVAESAIDALSNAALKPNPSAFYASTAGGWSDTTRSMLRSVVASLPPTGRVIFAFDNDVQGREYVESAQELLTDLGRELIPDLPPVEATDWNDVLRAHPVAPMPTVFGSKEHENR